MGLFPLAGAAVRCTFSLVVRLWPGHAVRWEERQDIFLGGGGPHFQTTWAVLMPEADSRECTRPHFTKNIGAQHVGLIDT
jgi:hypothetical protein